MSYLLIFLASAYFVIGQAVFTSHTYSSSEKSSDNSNIINLEPLDDTVFDVRYQTACKDCKCFVNAPILSYTSNKDFSFQNEVFQSWVSSGKIYLLHKSETDDISYSIYTIQAETITEVVKEVALPSYSGLNKIILSSENNAFVGYSKESVIINIIDAQGKVQEKIYQISQAQDSPLETDINDLGYSHGLLFLAMGQAGIQILKIKDNADSTLDSIVLTLQDLEVKEGFRATKLEIDSKNNLLYIYQPNSDQKSILVLDFSNKDEVSIVNNYDFGIDQINQILVSADKLYLVNHNDEKCFYNEFIADEDEKDGDGKYGEPKKIKLWEIPEKVRSLERNDGEILIDTENHLYVFRKDLPYEAEMSELLVDIVKKNGASHFFPITQNKQVYLLAIDPLKLTLASVGQRPQLYLQCGVFKQDYAGSVSFSLNTYRDSCKEAPNKADDNVCLDHIKYDVDFTGDKYTEFQPNSLFPKPTQLFTYDEWPIDTSNGTVETSSHPGQSHGGHTSNINHTQPNKTHNTSVSDQDPPIFKKPDLIDPDAPYYDRLNDTYALIIVGVIIFTCFGCLVKCLYDFIKNSKSRIARQFEHKELEEEESGSEGNEEQDTSDKPQLSKKKNARNRDEDEP